MKTNGRDGSAVGSVDWQLEGKQFPSWLSLIRVLAPPQGALCQLAV